MGDYEAADPNIRRALDLFRELGAGEGNSLTGFGNALIAAGDPAAAQAAWREAVVIFDRLPHPLADDVPRKLRELESSLEGDEDAALPPDHEQLPAAATTVR